MNKATSKYRQLLEQQRKLAKEVEAARIAEARQAIATVKKLIREFDLRPEDIGMVAVQQIATKKTPASAKTFKPKHANSRPTEPKYRDPATGTTWSGRGKQPRWIVGNRDDYLIDRKPQKRITQNNKLEAA
jgi:DNA-binding protein H-NS